MLNPDSHSILVVSAIRPDKQPAAANQALTEPNLLIGIKKSPVGGDLLSQGAAPQVPSALTGLTSGFGMGPGVPPLLESPTRLLFKYEIVNTRFQMLSFQ